MKVNQFVCFSTGKENDPAERIALIAAFAVSGYSSSFFRTHKPFNPLLGETFECVREDKGFRFLAEQVMCVRLKLMEITSRV